jgi:predicted glycosyltransferase
MFKRLIEELVKHGHEVLVTTRAKAHLPELYSYLGLEVHVIGEYGTTLETKLVASAERTAEMSKLVLRELGGLDAVVSNTGVEACRVGFGLGAQVHTFHDHPQAMKQLLLTIPLSDYIYVPWLIDRGVYVRVGVSSEAIIQYKGFLCMAWLPYIKPDPHILEKLKWLNYEKIVVFRESEMGAAYLFGTEDISLPAVHQLAEKHPNWLFIARPRYGPETLKQYFSNLANVVILTQPIDLQSLLAKADLLVGGGATMCLEAAYFGTPVITCRPIEAPITNWLINSGLAWKGKTAENTVELAEDWISKRTTETARKAFGGMEFPLKQLIQNIEKKEKPPHARLSDYIMQKLETIKERDGHKSLDSVLRYLLSKAGEI